MTMRTFLATGLAVLLAAAGCIEGQGRTARDLQRFDATREMMGTFVTITLWAASEQKAKDACDAAFAKIARIEALMSTYRSGSELSKINRHAYAQDVTVSDEMFEVLEQSLHYARISDGAFDVSMAPFKKLWESAARSGTMPGEAAVNSVKPSVGYKNIRLDEKSRTVRFLQPSMEIDLGGIAKGYAVDLALAELRRQSIATALVNAGGDIAVTGLPPDAPAWRIGIQKPQHTNERLPEVVHLTTGAVATSGDYERFVEIGGKRFSHIIDPRTGMPVQNVNSVTVIAPDATSADALATACSVVGPVEGLNLAARLADVDVIFLLAGNDGPTVIKSQSFDRYID